MSNLDVEHFHQIAKELIEGKPQDRQMGRSTTLLYLMLSKAMYVEDPEGTNFLFIGNTRLYTNFVALEFHNLLEKHEIPIHTSNFYMFRSGFPVIITGAKLKFHFYPMNAIGDSLRGIKFNEIYLDEFDAEIRNYLLVDANIL
jgi:hypothetical protein